MNFLEMIENHPVFQNESWNPQHNLAIQLAVSLFWFGSNGNGAAVYQLENFFSIGHGTVNLYTQNVPTSVLGFFFSLLFWPTKEEHIEISQVIWRFSRFYWICWWNHHCFKSKTQTWWKTYFDWKKRQSNLLIEFFLQKTDQKCFLCSYRHSIAVQLVCNNNKKFIFLHAGLPGSCHDSYFFIKMQISQKPPS